MFELCVLILTEAVFLPTHVDINFSLDLMSVSATAGKTLHLLIASYVIQWSHLM